MPCCFAVIRYLQCNHKNIFKLGCTRGCAELCPLVEHDILLQTQYTWRCEACRTMASAAESDARITGWEEQSRRIYSSDELSEDNLNEMLTNLEAREEIEESRMEVKGLEMAQEVQAAASWTSECGALLWELIQGTDRSHRKRALASLEGYRRSRPWDLIVIKAAMSTSKTLKGWQKDSLEVVDSLTRPKTPSSSGPSRSLTPVPESNQENEQGAQGGSAVLSSSISNTTIPTPPLWKEAVAVTITETPLPLD